MVYARTELVGNTQYYFYQRGRGDWEFTWDTWVNLARVDFNNFGACKFFIVFQRDDKKIRGSSQESTKSGRDGAVLILSQIPFHYFSTFKPLVVVGGLHRYKLENMFLLGL